MRAAGRAWRPTAEPTATVLLGMGSPRCRTVVADVMGCSGRSGDSGGDCSVACCRSCRSGDDFGVEFGIGRPLAEELLGSDDGERSEEHTSALQSLMRISYAVLCLT